MTLTDESSPALIEDDFFQEAYLNLEPRDARLYLSQAFGKVDRRSIGISAVLASDKVIVTQDGRSLGEASWTINLIEGDAYSDMATVAKSIGYLYHGDASKNELQSAPTWCRVEAAITERVFSDLAALLQAGHIPENLWIKVSGLKYGGFPFQRLWDTNERQSLHVTEVSLRTPLARGQTGAPTWPMTPKDLETTNALLQGIHQQLERMSVMGRLTFWATVLLAATIIAVAFMR